jgi:hypothetical protein
MEEIGKSLDLSLPKIECDFNAVGLGDEDKDGRCFYSFFRRDLPLLKAGARCILYSFDTQDEITACEALIEPYRTGWRGEAGNSFYFCGFRGRPFEDTWYWGVIPWDRMK